MKSNYLGNEAAWSTLNGCIRTLIESQLISLVNFPRNLSWNITKIRAIFFPSPNQYSSGEPSVYLFSPIFCQTRHVPDQVYPPALSFVPSLGQHQQGLQWCLGLGFCFLLFWNSCRSLGHTQGHRQVRQRVVSPLSLHSVISANSHSFLVLSSCRSLSQNTVSFRWKAPTPWISFYSVFRDLSCFPQCTISLSDFQAQASEGKRRKQMPSLPFHQ